MMTNSELEAAAERCRDIAGASMIAAERQRQVAAEGWTPEHDDEHSCGELSAAAICYAACAMGEPVYRKVCSDHAGMAAFSFVDPWPWDEGYDKRDIYSQVDPDDEGVMPTEEQKASHAIRCLVKAGALIAAEIDRLSRLPQPQPPKASVSDVEGG